MKFHNCMCKWQAIMCQLPFSIFNAVTLTFDLLTLKFKFHDDRCKGKEKKIMRHKPFPIINAL